MLSEEGTSILLQAALHATPQEQESTPVDLLQPTPSSALAQVFPHGCAARDVEERLFSDPVLALNMLCLLDKKVWEEE